MSGITRIVLPTCYHGSKNVYEHVIPGKCTKFSESMPRHRSFFITETTDPVVVCSLAFWTKTPRSAPEKHQTPQHFSIVFIHCHLFHSDSWALQCYDFMRRRSWKCNSFSHVSCWAPSGLLVIFPLILTSFPSSLWLHHPPLATMAAAGPYAPAPCSISCVLCTVSQRLASIM